MNIPGKCGFAIAVVLVTAGAAAADEFDDFRIPEHSLHDWRLELQVNGARTKRNDPYELDEDVRGRGTTFFRWLSDSDPAFTSAIVALTGEGIGEWSHNHSLPPFPEASVDREARYVAETWRVSAFTRRYPWDAPLGFSVGASLEGFYQQSWSHTRSEMTQILGGVRFGNRQRTDGHAWSPLHSSVVNLAVGWGRVRDASGVYEARLLEQRLLETNALARPLSDGTRRRLAALLTVRRDYENQHDRAAKLLWRRVAEILEEDGALSDTGLDPYSTLRAGEPHARAGLENDDLPRTPFLRNVGFFVGPTLHDSHLKQVANADNSSSFESTQDDSVVASGSSQSSQRDEVVFDNTYAGLVAEAHRPLGLSWQADVFGRVLFPLRESYSQGMTTLAAGNLSWMVSDRWEVAGSASYQRGQAGNQDSPQPDSWSWRYGIQATWYVEDRLALTFNVDEIQWKIDYPGSDPLQSDPYQRSAQLSLGLSYRILGGFEAPGLIPRETFAPF